MLSSDVGGNLDYSPVSWREYFDQMEDVNVGPADSTDIFRIYKAGSDGPLLVLLHGGGHSALSWAVFTVSIKTKKSINEGDQLIFIFSVADSDFQSGHLPSTGHGSQGSWWADIWQTCCSCQTRLIIFYRNVFKCSCRWQLHSDDINCAVIKSKFLCVWWSLWNILIWKQDHSGTWAFLDRKELFCTTESSQN